MILAYLTKHFDEKLSEKKFLQPVLEQAMNYVNATSGMQLSFNYPFTAHKTIEPCSQWVDLDGGISILENNNIIVCISDDETDETDGPNQLVDIRENGCTAIRFVSNKIHLSDCSIFSIQVTAHLIFFKCFSGTNFEIILNDDNNNVYAKCPLCCRIVDRKNLNGHFNDCNLFST